MKLRRYRKTKNNLYYYQFVAKGGVIIGENDEGYEERELRDKQFQLILKYGVNDHNIKPQVDAKNNNYFDVVDKKGNVLMSSLTVDSSQKLDEYITTFVQALQDTAGIRPRKTTDMGASQNKKPKSPPKPKNALLQLIEGVGPKSEEALNIGGILTFEDLSKSKHAQVQSMLSDAGLNTGILNFDNWIQQAAFAANQDWTGLRNLQLSVGGGNHAKIDKFEKALGVKITPEVEKTEKPEKATKEVNKTITEPVKANTDGTSQTEKGTSGDTDQNTDHVAKPNPPSIAAAGIVGGLGAMQVANAQRDNTSEVEYDKELEKQAAREAIEVQEEALVRATWDGVSSRAASSAANSTHTSRSTDGQNQDVAQNEIHKSDLAPTENAQDAQGASSSSSDSNVDTHRAKKKDKSISIDENVSNRALTQSTKAKTKATSNIESLTAESTIDTPTTESASQTTGVQKTASPAAATQTIAASEAPITNVQESAEGKSSPPQNMKWMWWIIFLILLSILGYFIF